MVGSLISLWLEWSFALWSQGGFADVRTVLLEWVSGLGVSAEEMRVSAGGRVARFWDGGFSSRGDGSGSLGWRLLSTPI